MVYLQKKIKASSASIKYPHKKETSRKSYYIVFIKKESLYASQIYSFIS